MSIELMGQVWKHSPYEGARLLLHLAMADHANDDGWFYAGQNSLARKARCSIEYVRQSVMKMVDDGLLVIEKKGSSRGRATEYRLNPVPQREETPQHPKSVGDVVQVDELPNSDVALPNFDGPLPNSARGQSSFTTISNNQDLVPATSVAEPNAGHIITAWIDGLRMRPPDRVIGQTSREVRLLLDQGFPPKVILEACQSISSKGLHPSTLASEVNTIINPPTRMTRGPATAEHRMAGLAHLLVGSVDATP